MQPSYLQRYVDAVAGKGAPLYNCFDFVGGTIAHICRPVLNKRVVYSHGIRVHGVKFQSVILPNDLIINLERQWEGRRHDCGLCFCWHGLIINLRFYMETMLNNPCTSSGPLPPRKRN